MSTIDLEAAIAAAIRELETYDDSCAAVVEALRSLPEVPAPDRCADCGGTKTTPQVVPFHGAGYLGAPAMAQRCGNSFHVQTVPLRSEAEIAEVIYQANGGKGFPDSIHGAEFWLKCARAVRERGIAMPAELVEAARGVRRKVHADCACYHCEALDRALAAYDAATKP